MVCFDRHAASDKKASFTDTSKEKMCRDAVNPSRAITASRADVHRSWRCACQREHVDEVEEETLHTINYSPRRPPGLLEHVQEGIVLKLVGQCNTNGPQASFLLKHSCVNNGETRRTSFRCSPNRSLTLSQGRTDAIVCTTPSPNLI